MSNRGGKGKSQGRGAGYNPANRFERTSYEQDEDWYDDPEEPQQRTVFIADNTKSILATNESPDLGFDVSLNPYRGCEHGCIYCYARPFHEYLGYSSGLDFETKILVKENAPELLRNALQSKSWNPRVIEMSGVTDAYQPAERRYRLTRRCLEVLLEYRNPTGIVTKNFLITRDLDILAEMAEMGLVTVLLSITTLDSGLTRVLEPRTSHPGRRLEALRRLSEAGIPTGVFVAPVIPGLTDSELPAILERARDAGASFAGFIPVKLPHSVAPLFVDWLERYYPGAKEKVLNRIRDIRGGKLHDSRFGYRMTGQGPYADHIRSLFHASCNKLGLQTRSGPLRTDLFIRQPGPQTMLF